MPNGERVLCVRSDAMDLLFPGLAANPGMPHVRRLSGLAKLALLDASQFVPGTRPAVEEDETVKQLVTYTFITMGFNFFVYRRTPKSDEARLRAKWSAGVGGHVQYPGDLDSYAIRNSVRGNGVNPTMFYLYLKGEAHRELDEEVGPRWGELSGLHPWGLIYDPTDPVGRVHLGVVFVLPVTREDQIRVNCRSMEDGLFLVPSTHPDCTSRYESWSSHLLGTIVP